MNNCCDSDCDQGRRCPIDHTSQDNITVYGWVAAALTGAWVLFLYSLIVNYG